jgi:heme/copper-type cytochrome/quinol oxidase subunit 3
MLYINFFWAWGHPEVYILVLPAFGVYSEVVPTFSQKRLFGYGSMVGALLAITVLSFIVWIHHFFTMGAGPEVNAFFGIMTMLIAIPTGVKIFNWLFTMYRGRVQFTTPMLWFLGFVVTFTLGGMAGVLMSIAPVDFQVHNSLFLVAHFHSVIIGGVVFGFFAAFTYWFPKFAGFTLNERLGRYAFSCWLVGFIAAFLPLYILGLMGATRRLDHYEAFLGWQPLFVVVAIGVMIILCGVGFQIAQVVVSILQRKDHLDTTGDPWNARTLEWSTSSPPPSYNFAVIPEVHVRDAFWAMKQEERSKTEVIPYYAPPKHSFVGFFIASCGFFLGFGFIWNMMWLVLVSLFGIASAILFGVPMNDESDEDTTVFGFWTYLMSDCILFSILFSAYWLLRDSTAGGPSGREIFNFPLALKETLLLLTSSFTCGLATFRGISKKTMLFWFTITFLLGGSFLLMEVSELSGLIMAGNSWRKSAFLSSYFMLLGVHGLHVAVGIFWIVFLMTKGLFTSFGQSMLMSAQCFRLFWHFLDFIWVLIFFIVYLMGAV